MTQYQITSEKYIAIPKGKSYASASDNSTGWWKILCAEPIKQTISLGHVLHPFLNYGIVVWGYAAKSNLKTLQVQQNVIVKNITNASQSISMDALHHDLHKRKVRRLTSRFKIHQHEHLNTPALQLLKELRVRRQRKPMPLNHILLAVQLPSRI